MNASSSARPPSVPNAPNAPRRSDSAPRSESQANRSHEHHQQGQQFDRLLRAKSRAHDERDAGDDKQSDAPPSRDTAPSDAGASGLAMFSALPRPSQNLTDAVAASLPQGLPGSSAGVDEPVWCPTQREASASQAALQSSLNAEPAALPLGASSAQAAGSWEVSMNQPLGAALQMRATRPESAGGAETQAGWTLTIGSSNVDASVLARHAPRLNERLRARVLTHTHVRIDEGPGGHDQELG